MPLLERNHEFEIASATHVPQVGVEGRRGPAQISLVADDAAVDLQAPMTAADDEVQGLGWDPDLGRPAVFGAGGAGVPYAVPVIRDVAGSGDEAVEPSSGFVDLEIVAGAAVAEGVQQDGNGVVPGLIAVAGEGVHLDGRRLRVATVEAEDQGVMINEHFDFGEIWRGFAGIGGLLSEGNCLRLLPGGFVEFAIDGDWAGGEGGVHEGAGRFGCCWIGRCNGTLNDGATWACLAGERSVGAALGGSGLGGVGGTGLGGVVGGWSCVGRFRNGGVGRRGLGALGRSVPDGEPKQD